MTEEKDELVIDLDANPQGFAQTITMDIPFGGNSQYLKCKFDVSRAWEEAARRWQKQHPRPVPTFRTEEVHDKETLAKLGETEPVLKRVYDPRDPAYIRATQVWEADYNRFVAAFCLKTKIRLGGKILDSVAAKEEALKDHGLTELALGIITSKIVAASMMQEDQLTRLFAGASEPTDGAEN